MARRLALTILAVALVLLLSSNLWAIPINPAGASSVTVTISGADISSFQLTVSCDSAVAIFGDPSPGSITGFNIIANKTGPGSVSISGFGTNAQTNGGVVATIPVTVVGTVGKSTSIRGDGSFTGLMGGTTAGAVSCSPKSLEVMRTLNIGASPNEGGTTSPPPGIHTYTSEGAVSISAMASPGWQFSGWSGGVVDPNNSTTSVIMDAEKTVVANFFRQGTATYTVTVSVNPEGGGTTEPSVGSHNYAADAVINLRAIPAQGWKFVDWTGSVADPASPITTINLTANKTVTANFTLDSTGEANPPVFTARADGQGGGLNALLLVAVIGAGVLGAIMATALFIRRRHRQFSLPSGILIPEPLEPKPFEPRPPQPTKEAAYAELHRVEYELGDEGILTVTGKAARRFREAILSKTTNPAFAFRIARSAVVPTKLRMFIDSQRPDDLVFHSQGTMLLLLGPDVVKMLDGVTIDYRESESGGTFTVSREGPA